MLYCLSFGSLNFREAEELLLGVTFLYYKSNILDYKRQGDRHREKADIAVLGPYEVQEPQPPPRSSRGG
ncbi:MAG: hypothetical protein HWQ41_01455 [Nostoc sp. NOS(2021)]|uniref:hypothetical protein n=1 Tax=Nostoc sp. NOS(2021) TaxID=2815407 RepID=UPI0025F37EEB|nr:hypothetical protein [Nostoc sp. NOS(2021)]MBN3894000.1 hypothetical protein [Nostoc sp. NOS(2021)]